ncbi:hypothetical protein SAMN05216567_113124 [Variovorax sp. OK605]|jgi:hypothetical protein|nr:hypothetical protein SAMN05216567_113124 [Variovorax sp. OK605]
MVASRGTTSDKRRIPGRSDRSRLRHLPTGSLLQPRPRYASTGARHANHCQLETQHPEDPVHRLNGTGASSLLDVLDRLRRHACQGRHLVAGQAHLFSEMANALLEGPIGIRDDIINGLAPQGQLLVQWKGVMAFVHGNPIAAQRVALRLAPVLSRPSRSSILPRKHNRTSTLVPNASPSRAFGPSVDFIVCGVRKLVMGQRARRQHREPVCRRD